MFIMRHSAIASALLVAALAGCGSVPPTITEQAATGRPRPQAYAAAAPANGTIFQSGAYRPLFEDRRPRMVGDVVTIAIAENTSAAKAVANSSSKSGSVAAGPLNLFGKNVLGAASGSTSNSFGEKGAASTSNTFTGTITTSVIEVLPNGYLVVSGEKQVAFDKGTEYVRFSGVVNPDRLSNNVIASSEVADARVEYRTNSRIDQAEFTSQIARFFMSMLPL
jgi:flagellar L-ring protein precursor FlgH